MLQPPWPSLSLTPTPRPHPPQVREAMARSISEGLPGFASLENTAVMRQHLTRNSYTSGSVTKGRGGNQGRRRGGSTQRGQR